MTNLHLKVGFDFIFAKDLPYKISSEGNEKILAPLATKKRVSTHEYAGHNFEESALERMNIQRFCFNDKYKCKLRGVEFTVIPEVLIFPTLGICIIRLKTEIPKIITFQQYIEINVREHRNLKYSYRGATFEGTIRDLKENIFKYVEEKIKKGSKKIRNARQELLIDAELYFGVIYEVKLNGKPVRFDTLRREIYRGGKMARRVSQLAIRPPPEFKYQVTDAKVKEMLSHECSFSKDCILLPWREGNLVFLPPRDVPTNLHENLVFSLELVNTYHALLLIYCSIVSEHISKAQKLLMQMAGKESFKGLGLAERAKKAKEIHEQYKELVNNLNTLKMSVLHSLLELKNPRLLVRSGTIISFFGAAAKETRTLDLMSSLEKMIHEFEITCNHIMSLISSEYYDLERKAREEQSAKMTSRIQILNLIFSGAVGLSAAALLTGETIPGTDIIITGWISLGIGLVFWALTAAFGLQVIRMILKKA